MKLAPNERGRDVFGFVFSNIGSLSRSIIRQRVDDLSEQIVGLGVIDKWEERVVHNCTRKRVQSEKRSAN